MAVAVIVLVYLHARYYDPALGRFISPDPTVSSGTVVDLNRYAYAGNNPATYKDPNGYDIEILQSRA